MVGFARSRRGALVVAGLLSLGVAGCASQAGGPVATGAAATTPPATSAASSSAPVPSDPVTPSPTPPSPTPAPGEWDVSAQGIGPLRLGRSYAELVADPDVLLDGSLETCATQFVMRPGYQFAVSFPAGEKGDDAALPTVTAVTAAPHGNGDGTTTVLGAGGVTFGSSAAAVEAAYPGGKWGEPAANREVERIYLVDPGPVAFEFAGDAVTAIVVGRTDVPYEYCG